MISISNFDCATLLEKHQLCNQRRRNLTIVLAAVYQEHVIIKYKPSQIILRQITVYDAVVFD